MSTAPRLPVVTRGVVDRLRRPGEPSGATKPRWRLPIDPSALNPGPSLRSRLPSGFPYTAPTWPGTVERPPLRPRVGVEYDTDWARSYPARAARLLLTELVTRPAVTAVAWPEVRGLDRIDHLRGPVIFTPNHASHVDTPLLLSVIPERWRHRLAVAGAADYFFDTRLKASVFALLLNAVPIERHRVDRRSAQRLADLLEDGWSLLIYPEGGRSPDGWGQPHRAGAAWLAARTGRPIVPVHVDGTRQILPRHGTKLRPGPTTVTFGRALRGRPEEVRVLADRVERAVAALADEYRTDWWSAARRAALGTTPPLTGPGAAGPWRRAWALGRRREKPAVAAWREDRVRHRPR